MNTERNVLESKMKFLLLTTFIFASCQGAVRSHFRMRNNTEVW
jgi:hypothetical protein